MQKKGGKNGEDYITEEEIKRWEEYFYKLPICRLLNKEEARIRVRIEAIKTVNKMIKVLNLVDNMLEELKTIRKSLINDMDYYSNNLCIQYFCAKFDNLLGYLDYLYNQEKG